MYVNETILMGDERFLIINTLQAQFQICLRNLSNL